MAKQRRSAQPPRMSVTVDAGLRKKIRIAAARADMEPSEWCRIIIATAATRTVEKLYPEGV